MIQIAIDGPAGAGKSTVAKALAKALKINYLDTGAMYRALAYAVINKGISISDREKVESALDDICMSISYVDGTQYVFVDGIDTAPYIRTPEISMAASSIGTIPMARIKLVELQRETASKFDIILDGRDIGTYVIPDAKLKFYITASSRERAIRRSRDLERAGMTVDIDEVEKDIIRRDEQDMNREFAPLRCADDAIYLDTTEMSAEKVLEFAIKKVKEVYGNEIL